MKYACYIFPGASSHHAGAMAREDDNATLEPSRDDDGLVLLGWA